MRKAASEVELIGLSKTEKNILKFIIKLKFKGCKCSIYKIMTLIVSVALLSSCATQKLWESTDPSYYVRVQANSVDETELKQKGLNYYKDNKNDIFYVEKTELTKLGNYSLRLFASPVTVTIDAATTIIVIGLVLLSLGGSGASGGMGVGPHTK